MTRAPGYLGNYTSPPPGAQVVTLGDYGMGLEMPSGGGGFMPQLKTRATLTATTTKTATIAVPEGTSTLASERLQFRDVLTLLERYASALERAARSSVELSGVERIELRREARRARQARSDANAIGVLRTAGWSRGDLTVLERMASSGGLPADQDLPLLRKVGGVTLRDALRLREQFGSLLAAIRARYASSTGVKTTLFKGPVDVKRAIGPVIETRERTETDEGASPPPDEGTVPEDEIVEGPPEETPVRPDRMELSDFERFLRDYPSCARIPAPAECGRQYNEWLRAQGLPGSGVRWGPSEAPAPPPTLGRRPMRINWPLLLGLGAAGVALVLILRRPRPNPRRRRRRRRSRRRTRR